MSVCMRVCMHLWARQHQQIVCYYNCFNSCACFVICIFIIAIGIIMRINSMKIPSNLHYYLEVQASFWAIWFYWFTFEILYLTRSESMMRLFVKLVLMIYIVIAVVIKVSVAVAL